MDCNDVTVANSRNNAAKRPYPASASDWDEQRDNFQRLYCTEDKSLPQVIIEMEQLHAFIATYVIYEIDLFWSELIKCSQRQYKQRIAGWHLDKKVKDNEMRAILMLQQKRKREGKDSVFYVRGRRVDPKKIVRFSKRKYSQIDLECGVELEGD